MEVATVCCVRASLGGASWYLENIPVKRSFQNMADHRSRCEDYQYGTTVGTLRMTGQQGYIC